MLRSRFRTPYQSQTSAESQYAPHDSSDTPAAWRLVSSAVADMDSAVARISVDCEETVPTMPDTIAPVTSPSVAHTMPISSANASAAARERSTALAIVLDRMLPGGVDGGALRVGLFAPDATTRDAGGRRREVRAGLERAPWIRNIIPFDARALAVLDRAEAVAASSSDATDTADDEAPRPQQLHQKTQLIARPGAIAAFVRQPGWEDALAAALMTQERRTARFAEQLEYTTPDIDDGALLAANALLQGFERSIPEAERKRTSFHFSLGTQNQDPRGIMLDGEATLIVSGVPAAAGLVDLFYLMARTRWVATQQQVDALLPPPSGFMRWVGRLIRPGL